MIRQSGGGNCLKRPSEKAIGTDADQTVEERLARLERRLDDLIKSVDTWSGKLAIAVATLESKVAQRLTESDHRRS